MRSRTTWATLVVATTLVIPAAVPEPASGGGGVSLIVAPLHPPSGATRPTLRLGNSGPAVAGLQGRLRALRADVRVDGRFGSQTHRAVVAFQGSRGLQVDGIVGPRTWQALDGGGSTLASAGRGGAGAGSVLRLGASGSGVAEAQRLLTRAGHRTAADGRFGPATERAVTAFQRRRGLVADGVVGPATWSALGGATSLTLISSTGSTAWRTIGARKHTVRRGETLGSIAAATGSTASALATVNRLPPGRRPQVGSMVLVPGSWRCPVPRGNFINDYGFPRPGGRVHLGNDIFARRGTPIVAPVRGRVERREGGLGGHALQLYAADGNRYYFAHLDHYGAAGTVAAGTVIGYVGNSGNAITTAPHLHFEIHPGDGSALNPFPTLTLACRR